MSGRDLEELSEVGETESKALTALKLPKKFKVLLLNDDYTPMEFVIDILKRFFYLNEETATLIMLQVHMSGKGVCGIFTRDVAETKVAQVNDYARNHEHPLLCTMEPE